MDDLEKQEYKLVDIRLTKFIDFLAIVVFLYVRMSPDSSFWKLSMDLNSQIKNFEDSSFYLDNIRLEDLLVYTIDSNFRNILDILKDIDKYDLKPDLQRQLWEVKSEYWNVKDEFDDYLNRFYSGRLAFIITQQDEEDFKNLISQVSKIKVSLNKLSSELLDTSVQDLVRDSLIFLILLGVQGYLSILERNIKLNRNSRA